MGILPCKVLCNAALCVFPCFPPQGGPVKRLDPDIEMNGKSGAGLDLKWSNSGTVLHNSINWFSLW